MIRWVLLLCLLLTAPVRADDTPTPTETETPTPTATDTPTLRACVVNSTSDADCTTPTPAAETPIPGDLTCDDGAGTCTMRCAFTMEGASRCRDNTITFNIPGGGSHTITLGSDLSALYNGPVPTPILLDGTTQPGTSCGDLWNGSAPVWNVTIDGSGVMTSGIALGIGTIQGLRFTNWGTAEGATVGSVLGELAAVIGQPTPAVVVRCNSFDGNAADAMLQSTDQGSILIGGPNAGDGNLIINNSGTGNPGLVGVGPDSVMQGNWIGVAPDGSLAANTNGTGIRVTNDGNGSATVIGGTDRARNLIAGQSAAGILVDATSVNVTIQDNLIGVDSTGSQDFSYCNCTTSCNGVGSNPPPWTQIYDLNSATLTGNTVGTCETPTPTDTPVPDTPTPVPPTPTAGSLTGCLALNGNPACAGLGGITCADNSLFGGPPPQMTSGTCDFINANVAPGCCDHAEPAVVGGCGGNFMGVCGGAPAPTDTPGGPTPTPTCAGTLTIFRTGVCCDDRAGTMNCVVAVPGCAFDTDCGGGQVCAGLTTNDGTAQSVNSGTYPPASCGFAGTAQGANAVRRSKVGSVYTVHNAFVGFDTSLLAGQTVVDARVGLTVSLGSTVNNDHRNLTGEYFDWGATITCADWTAASSSSAFSVPAPANGVGELLIEAGLTSPNTELDKTGTSKFRLHIDGGQPTAPNVAVVEAYGSSVGLAPYLVVCAAQGTVTMTPTPTVTPTTTATPTETATPTATPTFTCGPLVDKRGISNNSLCNVACPTPPCAGTPVPAQGEVVKTTSCQGDGTVQTECFPHVSHWWATPIAVQTPLICPAARSFRQNYESCRCTIVSSGATHVTCNIDRLPGGRLNAK